MERQIACFSVPSFEIELARLGDRRLRNCPTAVATGHSTRATLLEVSREARKEGLYRGMSLAHAGQICPGIRIIPTDTRRIFLGQKLLQESIKRFSPVYELANPGEFYVDLTGSGKLFGDGASTALKIQKQISESYGILGTMGVATNKLVSNAAATFSERPSIYDVLPGNEKSFLAPLPVSCLPGLNRLFGPETKDMLTRMEELCLKFIRHLAAVAADQLELVFHGRARLLNQWAFGIDPSPVWPETVLPLFEIFHALETDEVDDDILLNIVYRLLEKLCSNVRKQNRWLRDITLILQYSDGREIRKRNRFFAPTRFESVIYQPLQNLFLSVKRRVRVRRIGLIGNPAYTAAAQIDLFERHGFDRAEDLALAIDSIRERYGDHSISLRNNKAH